MSFLINPYAFLAAGGDFEPIATVTVGSGGASSIEFTSIPGTYQHLQVRMIARPTSATNPPYDTFMRLNSDSASNYARHRLVGSGAAASAGAASATTYAGLPYHGASNATAGIFAAMVVDILDYASTSKATTVRGFGGYDANGSGYVGIMSSLWTATDAVSTLTIYPGNLGSWDQYSTAALYGVKA